MHRGANRMAAGNRISGTEFFGSISHGWLAGPGREHPGSRVMPSVLCSLLSLPWLQARSCLLRMPSNAKRKRVLPNRSHGGHRRAAVSPV